MQGEGEGGSTDPRPIIYTGDGCCRKSRGVVAEKTEPLVKIMHQNLH